MPDACLKSKPVGLLACALFLFLSLISPGQSRSQEVPDTSRVAISGTVYNSWDGRPVDGAEVRFSGTDFASRTDTEGAFHLQDLLRGTYLMVVTAPGFQELRVSLRVVQDGSLNVPLEPLTASPGSGPVARVVGRIRAVEGGDGVEGAEVTLAGVQGFQVSGPNGEFEFSHVPQGMTTISVRYLGRAPLTDDLEVSGDGTLELDIRLAVEPVELEPMVVTVTPRDGYLEDMGFYNRRDKGYSGQQISQEFIEERDPRDLGDVFQSMPGVRVDYDGYGRFEVRMRRAIRLNSGGGCYPKLLIDDVPSEIGWLQNIPPQRVAGIEVYSGTNAPLRYNDPCGVILIWTRRGNRGGGNVP
ncbi:carboxypeptidase regulatory-like domain-containing protein [Gemmatimonadota bacterium]